MKRNIAILIGIGVLLYLWNKGYFKKKAPVAAPVMPEEEKYFDTNNDAIIPSPIDNDHPNLIGNGQIGATKFDPFAGEDISSMYATATGLRRKNDFGYVRN